MARIDCTMILVDAPGLRPTATDAPCPVNPTPIAAPRAARPTCKLPVLVFCPLCVSRVLGPSAVRRNISLMGCSLRGRRLLMVLADEPPEGRRQQHEDHP